MLNGILAFILGFGFAVAIAVAMEFIDRRLKDEEDVENAFGLPILATIPRPSAPRRRRSCPGEDRGQFEGYSALATNLRFFELWTGARVDHDHLAGPERGQDQRDPGAPRVLSRPSTFA